MNSKEYIAEALKTESVPTRLDINEAALHATLELMVGAANVADKIKRQMFYGEKSAIKGVIAVALKEELQRVAGMAMFLADGITYDQQTGEDSVNRRATAEELAQDCPPELAKLSLDQINIRLLHSAIGLFCESGEMVEAIKKQYETGELDVVNFGEELGDCDWYKAIGHDASGVSEEEARVKNIAKLHKKRYKNGFSEDAAINRDLTGERAILEGTQPEAQAA